MPLNSNSTLYPYENEQIVFFWLGRQSLLEEKAQMRNCGHLEYEYDFSVFETFWVFDFFLFRPFVVLVVCAQCEIKKNRDNKYREPASSIKSLISMAQLDNLLFYSQHTFFSFWKTGGVQIGTTRRPHVERPKEELKTRRPHKNIVFRVALTFTKE